MDQQVRPYLAPHAPAAGRNLRAVVAVPPVCDFYTTPHRLSALGAHTVAALLRHHGIPSTVLNFPLMRRRGAAVGLPAALSHLRPHIMENETGPLTFFTHYRRFGPPAEECAEAILELKPALCFISCFAFCYARQTVDLASAVKKLAPALPIVVGGAGASVFPRFFVKHECVDYALCGEAEAVLPLFVDSVQTGSPPMEAVPGLWRREGHSPVPAEPTRPAHIRPVVAATTASSRLSYLATSFSRGCSGKCRFCSNRLVHGNTYRSADLAAVQAALAEAAPVLSAGGRGIHLVLEDDDLLGDAQHALACIDILRMRLGPLELQAENGIDYARLTPELIRRLRDAGMCRFNLSLVSSAESCSAAERRSLDKRRYEAVLAELSRQSIPSTTYFICGLSSDTLETVAANLAYLSSLPTLCGISLFYPVPGLPDFPASAWPANRDPCVAAGSSAFPWNNSLSTQTMVSAFRLSRFVNRLKSPGLAGLERDLVERVAAEACLYTLVRDGKRGQPRIVEAPNQDRELVRLFFRLGNGR